MQQGHHPGLTLDSDSMAPLLRCGDQIFLEPVAYTQLRPGDVITVLKQSQFLTHRYWGTIRKGNSVFLITRGDRPLIFDPLWPASSLVGRVVACHRRGRRLNLKEGPGARLNRRLAGLAMAELRWVAGIDGDLFFSSAAQVKEVNIAVAGRQKLFAARLLRRFFLLFALITAEFATSVAR